MIFLLLSFLISGVVAEPFLTGIQAPTNNMASLPQKIVEHVPYQALRVGVNAAVNLAAEGRLDGESLARGFAANVAGAAAVGITDVETTLASATTSLDFNFSQTHQLLEKEDGDEDDEVATLTKAMVIEGRYGADRIGALSPTSRALYQAIQAAKATIDNTTGFAKFMALQAWTEATQAYDTRQSDKYAERAFSDVVVNSCDFVIKNPDQAAWMLGETFLPGANVPMTLVRNVKEWEMGETSLAFAALDVALSVAGPLYKGGKALVKGASQSVTKAVRTGQDSLKVGDLFQHLP